MEKIFKILASIIVGLIIIFAFYVSFKYSISKNSNRYGLPENIYTNPKLKEAYIFAIENPEILEKYPCYCGCDNIGHKNNRDCYFDKEGKIIEHASMCGGCVGITLDIKKMLKEGKTEEEIRRYIEEKYSPKENLDS